MASDSRRDRDDDFDDDRPARRRSRDDYDARDDYADGPDGASRRGPAAKGVNVLGVIALILGILGLPLAAFPCTFFVGLPLAGIGLILGVIGLFTSGKTTGRGFPIAGTSVGAVGVVAGVVWLVLTVGAFKKAGDDLQQAQERVQKQAQAAQDQMAEQAKADDDRRKKEEKELREGKAVVVTAERLDKDYTGNVFNADNKYKGKILEVTGRVQSVDQNRTGRRWIEFETEGAAVLRCEFPASAQTELARVEPMKTVTVRGRCKGKVKGRDGEEIVLENCVLVTK